MKKIYFTQRLLAYVIDFFIVYLVIAACTGITGALVPAGEKVEKSEKELLEKYEELLKNPESEGAEKFLEDQKENIYNIGKYGVPTLIFGIIVNVGYFGAFQYMNKGQTLGKKIVKIKVEENNPEKKFNYIRSVIRACLTYNVITDLASVLVYLLLKPSNFLIPYVAISMIAFFFKIVTVCLIAFRKDGRGLPDFIAGTHVVNA